MVSVLFVCLGNICRSPMAEAVFQKLVDEAGLSNQIQVDSSGTGDWHVGDKAHPGTRRILEQKGIAYNGRSRQITAQDMQDTKRYIIGMDDSNLSILRQRYGQHPRVYRLLEFAKNGRELNVPDPYYTNNFDYVYELVEDGCQGLLATIRKNEGI